MNKNKIVFVDESGDDGRLEGKSSDYYIVLALIVPEENSKQLLQHFKGVRARHFAQDAEMKSDTVGNNSLRRKQIVTDITKESFKLSILIVDKSKLTSAGFNYAQSFIKYIYGLLYQNISRDFNFVQVYADEVKSTSFTNELDFYVKKKNPNTLFNHFDIDFVSSENNECIQACDFLSGTIRRCVDQLETVEDKGIYLSHIRERSYIDIFPYSEHKYLCEITVNEKNDYDIQLEKRAIEGAYKYINEQKDSFKLEMQQQIYCLQILLSDYFANNGDKWLPTKIMREKFDDRFDDNISTQKLRGIIGRLRDNNVLIASKRSGGYKIPTCVTDLYEYLNTQNMTIAPMINRIRRANDLVNRATNGNVNILEQEEFRNLKQIIAILPQLEI